LILSLFLKQYWTYLNLRKEFINFEVMIDDKDKRGIGSFTHLIWVLAYKTLKLKYKNSVLGFFWSMLNPLMYLLIFTFVFSKVFGDIDRYPLYALTGIVFWSFFSTSTIQITESLIDNSGVLKSINVPPIAFPLSAQLASIISLGFTLVPFTILMLLFGLEISWELIFFIPILLIFTGFTLGLSLIITSLNVYFRDMQLAWTSFLPAIFYSAPIAFTSELIPKEYLLLIKLNPLYYYINLLRDVVYHNRMPDGTNFLIGTVLAVVTFTIGFVIFKKLERGFVSQF